MEKGWLDRFTALIPAGGTILDIGCGSGKPIAAYLIAQGYAVTGVDSSPTMIDMCSDRFPDHQWLVADMRTLTLQSYFAGMMAWDSFFHLSPDDQRKMVPIFRAHAQPGAPLLFTSGPRHGDAIGSFEGEPLYHSSLDPEEYRTLLRDNGFTVVDHMAEDPTCGGHTVWLAQRDNAD
jgi:SAM-dependent methyltransferase